MNFFEVYYEVTCILKIMLGNSTMQNVISIM